MKIVFEGTLETVRNEMLDVLESISPNHSNVEPDVEPEEEAPVEKKPAKKKKPAAKRKKLPKREGTNELQDPTPKKVEAELVDEEPPAIDHGQLKTKMQEILNTDGLMGGAEMKNWLSENTSNAASKMADIAEEEYGHLYALLHEMLSE